MLDPAPPKPQSDLVAKLRSSMNPGTQKMMQQVIPSNSASQSVATPPVQPGIQPISPPQPSAASSAISQDDSLQVLDEVLSEVENTPATTSVAPPVVAIPPAQPPQPAPTQPIIQPTIQPAEVPEVLSVDPSLQDPSVLAQALPTAVTQVAAANLNPPAPASGAGKEKREATTPDAVTVEAAQGIQFVEQEPNPEIPPEVDGFLKRAEDHAAQAPQEIVIADGTTDTPVQTPRPSQPVVVVPITPEIEKKGEHKSPRLSIRWLVEWSHKIMKKFVGKVIYREA